MSNCRGQWTTASRPILNVVRLRRNGDLSDEERQRLASTIFADQDEVGTFSRGNLIPPAPPTPPASNEPPAADPFFEQLQCRGVRRQAPHPSVRRRARRHSRVFRSPRLPDPSRDDPEHLAASGGRRHARQRQSAEGARDPAPPPVATAARDLSSAASIALEPADSRCSACPPRRTRRAGARRRDTGRNRRRRGRATPDREADRQQTYERTFIPRSRDTRPPLISWLPCRVRASGITPRPDGPHACTVATPHRRRTSCSRRIVGRHTRRRRVPLPVPHLPIRPRPRPSSPAPSSSRPQRRLRTREQLRTSELRSERELRCEQPACFWRQRDTWTRSFT